jgi:hypothetical protein
VRAAIEEPLRRRWHKEIILTRERQNGFSHTLGLVSADKFKLTLEPTGLSLEEAAAKQECEK